MSITMIGLDTAKSVFQVHAVNEAGKVEIRRKLLRSELVPFFEAQPACTVVLEACGAAHHWARVLTGLGHEVKLVAPEAVRPFVKRGKKNDAADAAAICEAASQPDMKFVPVKSLEQQGTLALHSVRSLLVKQQTMLANAMRGLATEFGLTAPQGIGKLAELMALVDAGEAFPARARQAWCAAVVIWSKSAAARCRRGPAMADLSLISEAAWREARCRAEVIRPLAECEHHPHHLVLAAATALGLSERQTSRGRDRIHRKTRDAAGKEPAIAVAATRVGVIR